MALIALLGAACAGNSAAASPPASSAPTLSRPPISQPVEHHHRRARYRRPPQFVMISFDGSGDPVLWKHWRAVGNRTGARFTFFVSGVYLLDRAQANLYHAPQHRPGSSDIGFSASEADVRAIVHQINLGYAEGNEIGTHYNGHFCAPYPGNVGTWTIADWLHELAQFHQLLHHAGVQVPDARSRVAARPAWRATSTCCGGRCSRTG